MFVNRHPEQSKIMRGYQCCEERTNPMNVTPKKEIIYTTSNKLTENVSQMALYICISTSMREMLTRLEQEGFLDKIAALYKLKDKKSITSLLKQYGYIYETDKRSEVTLKELLTVLLDHTLSNSIDAATVDMKPERMIGAEVSIQAFIQDSQQGQNRGFCNTAWAYSEIRLKLFQRPLPCKIKFKIASC